MKNIFKFSVASDLHITIGQYINILGIFLIPVLIMNGTAFHWTMAAIGYVLWNNFGIFTGYHRIAAHRQIKCPEWFKRFTALCANMMCLGPAFHWVAQHIAHHAHTDTEKDPHSPIHKGFWNVVFFLPYLTDDVKYIHGRHLITDPFYKWQVQYYWLVIITFALVLLLIDPFALVYFWLVPVGLSRMTLAYLTSVVHMVPGATNNYFLGFISAGEGWHGNHHDNPRSVLYHEKYDWWGMMLNKFFNKKS